MRRAVYGGSFDPFHRGHLALARELLRRDLCEVVLLVPAWRSPFKDRTTASPEDRLAMLRLGIAGETGLEVDDREVRRGGPSYTIETLRALHDEQPDAPLLLALGADAWNTLEQWREASSILELAAPVVAPRDAAPIPARLGVTPTVLDGFRMPVSSTDVRLRLLRGRPVDDALAPRVLDHIQAHGLYGRAGGPTCP